MDEETDLLQIKIERAKAHLSNDTLNAIAAVPWQAVILKMRETKGYTFEQLGDLETETELLLCGLLSPSDYPKELESRMRIKKVEANELVKEMNELVFSKIKEELIKSTEKKRTFEDPQKSEEREPAPSLLDKENNVLTSAGIEILPVSVSPDTGRQSISEKTAEIKEISSLPNPSRAPGQRLLQEEKLELSAKPELPADLKAVHPILSEKLAGAEQIPSVKTKYALDNITKQPESEKPLNDKKYDVDPYREKPE